MRLSSFDRNLRRHTVAKLLKKGISFRIVWRNDKAIAKLDWLLPQNGDLTIEVLKRDPFWDSLRDIDAFNTLIENPKYQIKLGNN